MIITFLLIPPSFLSPVTWAAVALVSLFRLSLARAAPPPPPLGVLLWVRAPVFPPPPRSLAVLGVCPLMQAPRQSW